MRPLAFVLACPLVLGAGGCTVKHGKLRPGFFVNPTSSRDPDPTRNFTQQQEENPWAPEGERAPPPPGSKSELLQTAVATLAVIAAGVMPSLIWTSTFDESSWFESSPAHRNAEQMPQP